MGKYGITADVYDTYVADFHGTTVELFARQSPDAPSNKAVCYDCHGVHDIRKVDDPQSHVIKQNLIKTCQRCHPGADPSFIGAWIGHYRPSPEHNPITYYVELFYRLAIPAILGFMLLLVLLDAQKRIRRRREGGAHASAASDRVFPRFTGLDRVEHWLMVVSFTMLAVTGLPQKFAGHPVAEGIKVVTDAPKVLRARRLVIDLLWSRSPDLPILRSIAQELGVTAPSFPLGDSECILCDLCTRVCNELEQLGVIGMQGRGSKREVLTPFGELADVCQECGACGFVCPTAWIHEVAKIQAPCTLTCPAGINVQGYVQLVNQGKDKEAVKLIMERLPLPGTLGRICPHPCEEECRRQTVDEPVAIRDLKRLAADRFDPRKVKIDCAAKIGKKVAIIGSGPAGLSAGYHLAKKGVDSVIFEALPKAGGMLRVGIPDHRLPREVLDKDIEVITNLGVEIKLNTRLGKDFTVDSLDFKNTTLLRQFVTDQGRILPRKYTGLPAHYQRRLNRAIKRARQMLLMK